ncbi:chemotaxis protein CheW [Piscinibacter sp.]|uniref:chemotaxis protein CheW n=1 Tax=Piscinibacter sp. TaxID=1903157 RepID=UPI002F3FD874
MDDRNADLSLICRVQARLCALPLAHVVETLRALPVEAVVGAPHFVRGLAVIRGAPVPVVDTARLLGEHAGTGGRFVTVTVGERRVALAVDSVLGVRPVPAGSLHQLPPLLQEAGADVVAAIGLLDAELLLVLHSTRLLPDDAWGAGEAPGAAA